MEHNNDFKFDLEFGILGEKLLAEIFTNKKVEVKRDKIAAATGNLAIEYESRGKPSGISTSQAEWWCFILSGKLEDKIIIIIELEKLKDICRIEFVAGNIKSMGDNNTSKAILIPIKKLNTY